MSELLVSSWFTYRKTYCESKFLEYSRNLDSIYSEALGNATRTEYRVIAFWDSFEIIARTTGRRTEYPGHGNISLALPACSFGGAPLPTSVDINLRGTPSCASHNMHMRFALAVQSSCIKSSGNRSTHTPRARNTPRQSRKECRIISCMDWQGHATGIVYRLLTACSYANG
ncbi:hypothetical protein SCHPADRAFT_370962 [Schizopora paradoxa]|uniref:Uncharacterized protein n=1 Tax=Schizopora paradoxa TaxID=27342 RepID=A0A0H2RP26_9AGAM|nr:hypothetical protein SCHPADRAFT_370962 [Schizopora paradoxa]